MKYGTIIGFLESARDKALAEDPQRLEQLGIVVLNQARRKTKVTA